MKWITVMLALALAACSTVKEATPEQKIAAGCASVAASVRVLTVALDAGKLTASQQYAVSNALDYVTPICTAEKPPTLSGPDMILFGQSVMTMQQEAVRHE